MKCRKQCEERSGRIQSIVDESTGKWPFNLAKNFAKLSLRCADMSWKRRPDMSQVWAIIEPLVKVASQSAALSSVGSSIFNEGHVPSHLKCPILQVDIVSTDIFIILQLNAIQIMQQ